MKKKKPIELDLKWNEVVHSLRCCAERNCVECPKLYVNDYSMSDEACSQELMEFAAELMDGKQEKNNGNQ